MTKAQTSSTTPSDAKAVKAAAPKPKTSEPSGASKTQDAADNNKMEVESAASSAGGSKSNLQVSQKVQAREKRREEQKALRERVRLALWPTPEAESNLKRKTLCQEIDYGRLQDSVRFRDAWLDFSRQTKPTSKARDSLIKLAIDILAKKSGKHSKRAAETPSTSGESTKTNKSEHPTIRSRQRGRRGS